MAAFQSPHALRRWQPPHQPDESPVAKAARYAADRWRLAALDDRPLMDFGLDRHAVAAGLPFQGPLTQHRRANQHRSHKP
jgi:uncharacterized protein YjiS (DUF1127 family)